MSLSTRLFSGILFFLASTTAGIGAVWQMPPTTITPDNRGFDLSEADNNGHVMLLAAEAVGISAVTDVNAYYYTNGMWTLSTNLFSTASFQFPFSVAMDPSGTALAIYSDDTLVNTVNTRYFDGSSWSTPTPDPLDNVPATDTRVAMNGPGQGVAVWTTATNFFGSFFSGGTWSSPQTIGPSSNISLLDPAYSANGTVVVVWFDPIANNYFINNFDGLAWQSPQILASPLDSIRSLGIDANGNAYIAGLGSGGTDIFIVHFDANTSTIDPSQVISTAIASGSPSIAVAPNGTAVATWFDISNQGLSSAFNGISWSAEFPFSFGADLLVFSQDVSVDTIGNALVVWETSDGSIKAARLPLGSGVWSVPSELVAPTAPGDPNTITSALSANGTGFAAWSQFVGEFENALIVNASINEVSPPSISGTTCANKFAMQTDIVNIITFTPSTSPNIVSYYLRRNGVLIAVIPASGPFIYYDHNRNQDQTYTYSLIAVDSLGMESTPVILVMKG